MDKAKHTNEAVAIKVIGKSAGERTVYVLIMLFVVGFAGWMVFNIIATGFEAKWLLIGFLVLLVAIMFWSIWRGMTQTFAIYDNGIEYRIGKQRAFATWENLSHFEWHDEFRNRTFGIVTHSPVTVSGNPLLQAFRIQMSELTLMPLSNVITIPTLRDNLNNPDADLDKFRETEFGQLLYQYAPHLFDENLRG